jgi:hypothetical protein
MTRDYDNKTWMLMCNNGDVMTSSDNGNSWVQQNGVASISVPSGRYWRGLANDGNGTWMAMNDNGKVAIGMYVAGGGTIRFTNFASDRAVTSSEYEIAERQEFYIEPSQISDADNDGNYSITFDMKNIRLISAEITNRPYSVANGVHTYTPLRLPEASRVVNFLQKNNNNFVYNIGNLALGTGNNYISYGTDAPGAMGVRWNNNTQWELYQNAGDHSSGNYLRLGAVPGDFFMLAEPKTPIASPYHKVFFSPNNTINDYFGTELIRSFWPFFSHQNRDTASECGYRWETYSNNLPLIFAGLTLPINATLYNSLGVNKGLGGWYLDDNNQMDYDATHACQRATATACDKLKEAYGDNLRIYVVKYRKQNQFKHKITGASVDFDYSYVDNCATNENYVYDATDESSLQDRLQDIANDIKLWATYTPARLCDE